MPQKLDTKIEQNWVFCDGVMAIHKLYGELAVSLVQGCWRQGVVLPRAGADLGGWGGLSAFEGANDILRRLGLATVDDRLTVDTDQVFQFISDRSQASHMTLPPIDAVLAAWISLMNQLGRASLKRLPFVPHNDIMPVMDALVGLDYARMLDNTFLWTDKIGRAMQMSGWWDEQGFSYEELQERDVDREMRSALTSIPEEVRLAALRDDQMTVAKALQARWVAGAWLPDSIDDASPWRWAALGPEAKRLVQLVQGADGPSTLAIN
ncbi:hypothetical protein ACFQ4O_02160 [Methylopila musalis]|uniref:Uncharacterized protein n=1 Tax=Methylopila musalis TaxID=1134781 RepID=A0ABW3Z3R9_9HYPH